MKFSTVTVTLALGLAFLLFLHVNNLSDWRVIDSFAVSAAPTAEFSAAPAKFAIQITATMGNPTKGEKQVTHSLYLAKGANGLGTTDLAQAESCSIDDKAQLICGGKVIGAKPATVGGVVRAPDMAALEGVDPSAKGVMADGFRIEGDSLHWKSKAFATLPTAAEINSKQGGEAAWGLLQSQLITGGQIKLYSQLGCPGGAMGQPEGASHGGQHDVLYPGKNKIVPL
jgi:hypothetical protein